MQDRPLTLDRIDMKILATLQENARITNAALSDRVGLSQSPCLQRVKRLEKAGYIEGYHGRINLAKLGQYVFVFVEITLRSHNREDFIKFESNVRRLPFVLECHNVGGGFDFLLKIVARDVSHYQDHIDGMLARNMGIDIYRSRIVIRSSIDHPFVPLDAVTGSDEPTT